MTVALADLLPSLGGPAREWAWAALLVFLRVGAAMALLPAFGEAQVPARVRLVLALAFSAIVLPAVEVRAPEPHLGAAGAEVLAGLILGIGLRLLVLALQTAAAIAANALSLAQLFAGAGPEPQPAFGMLVTMAGLALAVALGLHVKLASLMILSYDFLPAGRLPMAADVAAWGIGRVGAAFALAFSLAAPFVLAALVYNLALGVISRAMPQLMVTMVGAPALTGGALALMALVVPAMLSVWHGALDGFLANPVGPAP